MRKLHTILVLVLMLSMLGVTVQAQAEQTSEPQSGQTTIDDQTDVAVTIYNNNLALVRDRRTLDLSLGQVELKFMDVAAEVRPETVSLRSIAKPGSLDILEQNYEFDLMSPAKLMEKYVGQNVELVNFSNEIGFSRQKAKLLSVNGGPMYEIEGAIYLGHPGTVVLPEIPGNLIAKPTLVWLLTNEEAAQEIEVAYLTRGIGWKADYVLSLNREETQMDLAGWVTLTNNSGTQYTNAQLKLVAGDVHQVHERVPVPTRKRAMMAMAMESAPMREEAFAEYHLYTLPRRTTIKENQSKQVSLLNAAEIDVHKSYEFRGKTSYYFSRIPPLKKQKVAVMLNFSNDKSNSLGMPLPGGVMRVYQQDLEGTLQFAGEDRIQHTPKDEEIKLRLGNAFDIVGERKQTDFERIATELYESAFEIKIRNHKEIAVSVDIVEPMRGDWTILEKSHDYKKRDAHTAVFTVKVPKDGETVVTYRVRIRS